jgi:hypothetical protein
MNSKKQRPPRMSICIGILFAGFATTMVAQTFTVFDVPGANATQPVAINNGGDVAGYSNLGGFVRQFNGKTAVFDGIPTALNEAGAVTGYLPSGSLFVRDQRGNVTPFTPKFIPTLPYVSFATAINNSGEVAGYIEGRPFEFYDYLRDRQGTITFVLLHTCWAPASINARGDITGYVVCGDFRGHSGFIRSRNGDVTFFQAPGAEGGAPDPSTYPVSINNGGDVTGSYIDYPSLRYRGFVRNRDGTFATFDAVPGALSTMSVSINEKGDVTGMFQDATGRHDFVRANQGNITVFDGGYVTSINDRDDVTGYFSDGTGTHGFVYRAK